MVCETIRSWTNFKELLLVFGNSLPRRKEADTKQFAGRVAHVRHSIDTEGHHPIRQTLYPVSQHEIKLIQEQVEDMIRNRVIQSTRLRPVAETVNGRVRHSNDTASYKEARRPPFVCGFGHGTQVCGCKNAADLHPKPPIGTQSRCFLRDAVKCSTHLASL